MNGHSELPNGPVEPHILIIGAGITGLTLGQALKKANVSFTIFERDPDVHHRGSGWGLTIHWALQTFVSLLPQHLIDRLPETLVDPDASAKGENGNFLFFDLSTGETKYRVPPSKRLRMSRERLRALLLDGLDIHWSKELSSIDTSNFSNVTINFTDTTSATGTLAIGCDGSKSIARSILCISSTNNTLPVRLLGVSTVYPTDLALKIRALDPFFLQGADPKTNVFLYYSFLDTPSNNSRKEKNTYTCQILTSWPYKKGFLGRDEPLDVPTDNKERIKLMKEFSKNWAEPFHEIVKSIPEDGSTLATRVALEDWVPKENMWDNKNGRVTLVGDAAHAMTMYRGEAANHGITDISILLEHILPVLSSPGAKGGSMKSAVDAYEQEMISRTGKAVLTSRRACLDAHVYEKINDDSPLVSRRAVVLEE